jgi:hypothetical protein
MTPIFFRSALISSHLISSPSSPTCTSFPNRHILTTSPVPVCLTKSEFHPLTSRSHLANARAIYGATRQLDIISFAPTSSRKIGAAIVEHNPTGRSYIHCSSAKEDSRLAAVEHLLVITEDIVQRLLDTEGITSSGRLPATAQAQHAAQFNAASVSGGSIAGSVVPTPSIASFAGSGPASRRSSIQPSEYVRSRDISTGHIISDTDKSQTYPDGSIPHSPLQPKSPQQSRPDLPEAHPHAPD